MIYADYASTTPLHPRVLRVMEACWKTSFHNPSSPYREGRRAASRLQDCREAVAGYLGAAAGEILFTSGGTEADNLAVKGVCLHPDNDRRRIITSRAEHHAVLESCRWLESRGFAVTRLPVDRWGRVSPADLEDACGPDVCLVSLMWVNNETGAVNPVQELAAVAHRHGAFFHTDAVQAMACLPRLDIGASGADLISLSGHKIYGPKGVGALYCSGRVPLEPLHHGGQQEQGLRGGTEALPLVAGLAEAVGLLALEAEQRLAHCRALSDRLVGELRQMPGVRVHHDRDVCVPSIIHLAFPDVEAEAMLFHLSARGILVSMGAACNSRSLAPSHVVEAMGVPPRYARGCLRISLGEHLTVEDMGRVAAALRDVYDMARDQDTNWGHRDV